jgi:hypothetical protein
MPHKDLAHQNAVLSMRVYAKYCRVETASNRNTLRDEDIELSALSHIRES